MEKIEEITLEMKNALIVSNSSGLVSLFLKNDIVLLKQYGYSITCACNTNYPDRDTDIFFEKNDIEVIHVDFPIRELNVAELRKAYCQLKKVIKSNHFSLVHCHTTIASALCRQCLTRNSNTTIIYTSHGFPFYEGCPKKKAILYRAIENHYSKKTDAIITICREDFNNAKAMKAKSVFRINGVGVDLSRFADLSALRNSYRKHLGFADEDIVVLSIGELNTNKNHQAVIRALSLINTSRYVYVVCGREVTEEGMKDRLELLAKSLGVRLQLLGFREDIPAICSASDLGAIVSYKEGLGLSGIEMLASGIPVVGSNRQGIKDYVINGVTGYLANPNDPLSIKNAIINADKLRKDTQTRINCTNMAQQFSSKNSYAQMNDIYCEVLGRKMT